MTQRIGMVTYASAEPFHCAQMDRAEATLVDLAGGRRREFRRYFANRDPAQLDQRVGDLIAWDPDIIMSFMTNADLAVLRATSASRTPIVCWSMDPLDSGLVQSMSRPGGQLTGVAFPPGHQTMQLRALRMLRPSTRRVAILHNPGYAIAQGARLKLEAAGTQFGIEIVTYQALTLEAVREAIPAMAVAGCDGLVVGPHELFNGNGDLIGRLALEHGLPTIAMDNIVEAGGVVSFMPDFPRIWAAAATIADRILRGACPGDIPIDRHIKPWITLNLASARRLGLELDPLFVDEADRRID